jgi:hypothetical protein
MVTARYSMSSTTEFHVRGKAREIGLTDEIIQDCLTRVLAGEPDEPLPDKQTVRDMEKKLRRPQRLIRVWEFALEDGSKPLVFELADGSIWQLSGFQEIAADWKEQPVIKPHLPAEITPRPKGSKPWDYEFQLGNRAVLWVKPGPRKRTFKWGVRMSNQSAR